LLLGLGAVVLSIFVAPGCTTWHTRKYGDAKLRRENYHFRNIRIGTMPRSRDFLSLPQVTLDSPATNIFRVRDFPTNQSCELTLELPRTYPVPIDRDHTPLPWHQARIRLVARELNGHDLFERRIALNNLPSWDSDKNEHDRKRWRPGWNDSWRIGDLEKVLRNKSDYDLLVIVEQPSTEKGNTIRIRGEGAWHW
jgi:hypothetical protein